MLLSRLDMSRIDEWKHRYLRLFIISIEMVVEKWSSWGWWGKTRKVPTIFPVRESRWKYVTEEDKCDIPRIHTSFPGGGGGCGVGGGDGSLH